MPTALEIAQTRNAPFSGGLIMALQDRHPLFSSFDFRAISGTSFLSLALVELAKAAKFAGFGEGFEAGKSRYELRQFACKLIGAIVEVDTITEERWNADGEFDIDWFDQETLNTFRSSVLKVEQQMIRGTVLDADGFPGAKELTPFITGNIVNPVTENAAKYDYARSVINAAGTTASTASSVYSFRFGATECQGIIGGAASTGEFLRLRDERLYLKDMPNDRRLEHRGAQMDGYVGLSVSGHNAAREGQEVPTQYSVRRIANLTADSGKGLTDQLMVKLSRSHGVGVGPDLLAMSERSGEQLATSRAPVATHFIMGGGDAAANQANQYPDPPDNWRGVPIVYPSPDVIGDTDAIEAV